MRLGVLALGALVAAGCAGPFRFKGPALPYAAKVWLLDAEEELLTARSRADEAQLELVRAQEQLAKAQARLTALGLGSGAAVELKEEARAQVALARSSLAWRGRAAELSRRSLDCADLRFEAAVAEAQVRYPVEGAGSKQDPRLIAQAQACDEKLRPEAATLSGLAEARDTARAQLERSAAQAALKAPLLRPRPYLE